ncbi:MAG: DNA polymerase [Ignavibacteria bacterium]|nr:DNA polymerase [Ignavibacteria bacterium]
MLLEPKGPLRHAIPHFATFDIEANFWDKFQCAGYYDGENYVEILKPFNVVSHFINMKKSIKVFAHYGGGYDFLFLLEEFCKRGIIPTKIIMRGAAILMFKIKTLNKKTVTFYDSFALLPSSLAKLTKSFNVETKKGNYDHSKNRPYNPEMAAYLKSDCIGLYQVLKFFWSTPVINNAGFAYTVAAQSHKVLQTFLKESISSLPQDAEDHCRKAIFGGRCEVFKFRYKYKKGMKKLRSFDVVSLYPFVMWKNWFPSGRPILTSVYKKGHLGIYQCEVVAPDMDLPLLPTKPEQHLMFTTGEFTGYYTSAEIEYALELGYKIKIISGYYFTKKARYFKRFVETLFKFKALGGGQGEAYKYVLNAGWGRFAINPLRENIDFGGSPGLDKHDKFLVFNTPKGKIRIYSTETELTIFRNTAIAAFVTSYARIVLHKKMMEVSK